MKLWLQPIRILLLYLVVLAVTGTTSWAWNSPQVLLQNLLELLLLFAGYKITHLALVKLKKIQVTRWEHQVITCLILYLLFTAEYPWYAYLIIGALTEVMQRVFRLPTGPLANPAGLAVATVAFAGYFYQWTGFMGWFPLWWGASFAPRLPLIDGGMSIAALLTIPVAGWVAYKYKKQWIVLTATITLVLLFFFVLNRSPWFVLLEGTFAFFLLVMAIEPKTSPIMRNQQILYGITLSTLVVMAIHFSWYEAYSMALVIANLIFTIWKNKALLFRKPLKSVQPQVNAVSIALNKPPQSQG